MLITGYLLLVISQNVVFHAIVAISLRCRGESAYFIFLFPYSDDGIMILTLLSLLFLSAGNAGGEGADHASTDSQA